MRIANKEKGHRVSDLALNLCRKLLSAALAPSLQNETAAFRLHTLAEAMSLFSPMVIRLISLFHSLNTSFIAVSTDFLSAETAATEYFAVSRSGGGILRTQTQNKL